MDKLNFYTADLKYVQYLQNAEQKNRGFSRVPNMAYSDKYKQKFLCGIVLQVNGIDYYVPVTSYKQQKPDNFLIKADNGQIVSSLRFNYMFPIPKELVEVRIISNEPDRAYRALLAQELRCCIKNQTIIQNLAERTYKRVLLGKDIGLVVNSCDYKLLERKYHEYSNKNIKPLSSVHLPEFADVIRKSFATVAKDYGLTIENFPNHWSFATNERLSEKLKNECYSFGYFKNEKLVGFVSLADIGKCVYELGTLAVLPEYRHLGYGKALINFCKEKTREFGGNKIVISLVDTHTVLKEWYLSNDFLYTETKKYEHIPLPIAYMEWLVDKID